MNLKRLIALMGAATDAATLALTSAPHAESAPNGSYEQIFEFGPESGRETIITDGIELADFDLPFTRAITGATGRLADFDDRFTTWEQVYVGGGLNVTGGFNTELAFRR